MAEGMSDVARNDMALDLAMANSGGANRPVLPTPQTTALGEPPDVKDSEGGVDSLAGPDMGKLIAQHQIIAGQSNHGNARDWAENAVAGVQAALAGFGAGGKVPPGAGALYGVGAAARQGQEAREKSAERKSEQQQRQQQLDLEKQRVANEQTNANREYDLKTQENARQQAESVRAQAEHDKRMQQMDDEHNLHNLQTMHAEVQFRREQADYEDTLHTIGAKPVKVAGQDAPVFDDLGKLEDWAHKNGLGEDAHLNGYRTRPVLGGDNKYHLYEVPDTGPEWHDVKGADGKTTKIFTDPLGVLNYTEKVAQINEANARASLTYSEAKKARDDYKEAGTAKEARKELDKVGGDYSKLSPGAKEALTSDAQKEYQLNWNVYQGAQRDMQKDSDFFNVPINAQSGAPDTNSKEYKELAKKYHIEDAREQLDSSYTELRQLGHGYKPYAAEPSKPGTVGNPAPSAEQAADFLKGPPKPKTPGEPLDEATAKQYMEHVGGDKAKARELAKADGWGLGQ